MHFSSLFVNLLPCIGFIGQVAAASLALPDPPRSLKPRQGIYKRETRTEKIDKYIGQCSSTLFALQLIMHADTSVAWCDPSKIPLYNAMGFDGAYVEAWLCAFDAGYPLFAGQTYKEATANMNIACQGLREARDRPDGIARRVYCEYFDLRTVMQAELDAKTILDLVCYDSDNTTSTGTATGTAYSATTSINTTTTDAGNMTGTWTSPTCLSAYGTGGYSCASTFNTGWITAEPTPTDSIVIGDPVEMDG